MFKLTNNMLDKGLAKEPTVLNEALADTTFAGHGYYGVMPRELRLLLAEAATTTAQQNTIFSPEPITQFVQAMVDMSPRFWCFEPFKDILANPRKTDAHKMTLIMSDEMVEAWEPMIAHLQANEDWHLEYWDLMIDWTTAEVRH
ncbi:hypothetical protein [Yoonia sp. 2307UL14-13]|uniref:hypothetical protein n=1 Tax=Yoonia sp. 2307UL14-13 TaxID=3126506 RepID=UPI00309BF545